MALDFSEDDASEDYESLRESEEVGESESESESEHSGDEDYVDLFKYDDALHPQSNAPEPKRRFIPSKWESKKVVQYVRAIRKGLIKFDKPKEEEPNFYLLWGDDSSAAERTNRLAYIPAPKPKLPGHEESYNPSLEYMPTQEELNSYQLMYEEGRPKFTPKRFTSFRNIAAYENAVKDSFERCMDLYLCPRVRKKRLSQIDPVTLKPKLPSREDLKPYPVTCYLEYKGHKGAIVSISTETSGQWIASDVLILNTGLGNEEEQRRVKELLQVEAPTAPDDNMASIVRWLQDDKLEGIRLRHFKTVSSVEWHRRGDYLSTVMPAGESRAILMHQLSKNLSHRIPFKLHGLPVSSVFHPTRSIFFVSTKKNFRVYDLLKQKLIKKLETGLKKVSSIAHPADDNVIVGSREGKLCWFDMDLSSKPYRVLKTSHVSPERYYKCGLSSFYPLFASCSDDCTAYVFHGIVYSDLNQNPLIVPLEVLRGHTSSNGRGVMDCKFHLRQPWLFTAGADSVIRLFCH